MTRPTSAAAGEAKMLYGLLEEIDRAGYLRGTASWLEWLRLKSAASRTSAKANARALYALLAEIHRLGLIAGTDAHARWLMLKAGVKRGVAAVPTGSFPSCQGQFFFWRGRQMQRAVVGDVRHHFEPRRAAIPTSWWGSRPARER